MSLKKTDLAKNLALKIGGRMRSAAVPDRFAQGHADGVDKREQRRRDAAAGLIPFACKLPADLVKRLHAAAEAHEGGVNALLAELVARGLDQAKTVTT
jgi:hypothetical protein